MKPRTVSRRALLGTGAAAALLQALPAVAQSPAKPLVLDDASRLSATPVARHWRPARVTGDAWLDALRAELKAAAAEGRPVALGAARHSMGGQAIILHGVLDLPFVVRVLMNLPHIAIGGFAAFTGFVLARRWALPAAARG